MKHLAIPLAAALALAGPAAAQQTGGTISATVDLDQHEWNVGVPEEPASGWRPVEDGVRVRLAGVAAPEAAGGIADLTLEFDLQNPLAESKGKEFSVTLARQAEAETLFAGPENTTLTINAAQIEGGELVVAGDFTAVLTPGGADRLVQTSAEDAVTIDGNFQATVQKADAAPEARD